MPGGYVGTEAEGGNGIPFHGKMKSLSAKLAEQIRQMHRAGKAHPQKFEGDRL